MGILVDDNTRVVVQGITGRQGRFHAMQMAAFGTKVVAGVSPGKGGQVIDDIPVTDTVKEAVEKFGANSSVVFVPAAHAKDAVFESIDAGIKLIVVVTEHIPVRDAAEMIAYASCQGARIIGPNTVGIVRPGVCKIGIMPNHIYASGSIGIVARSGTLSYQIAKEVTDMGFGQSTALSIGGDPIVGISFEDTLEEFENDKDTDAVILIGEIGGSAEERAADFIRTMRKPVIAYLAGKSSPPGKRMGHAGAIIERGQGTIESKRKALQEAGATVVELPWEIKPALCKVLSRLGNKS